MELRRVIIENFRSISIAEIKFAPRCRILIGINESGKSNILKALALLDSSIEVGNDDLRENHPDENPITEGFVKFIFGLSDEEKQSAVSVLQKSILGDVDKPIVSIGNQVLSISEYLDRHVTETLYRVNLKSKLKQWSYWATLVKGSVEDGWVKPSKMAINYKPDADAVAEPMRQKLKSAKLVHTGESSLTKEIISKKEYFEKVTFSDVHYLVNDAIHQVVKERLPSCIFWEYKESNILPASIDLSTFRADPDTCLPMKHMFLMAGFPDVASALTDFENRPNGIRNLLKRVSDKSTKHMHAVWKDYKGLKLQLVENGGRIEAYVEDKFNAFDVSRRSDGFKRFITFLLLVSAKAKASDLNDALYLHDEPEISLHPSGARYLRDELIRISKDNHVVYSTHSTFMIDRENISRHLIVKKYGETTVVENVDDSNITEEEVLFNALGVSIFENLKEKNIIFEGWRDKELFTFAVKHIPPEKKNLRKRLIGVGKCFAKGVKDIGRISPILELAGRDYIVISDGDKPAREQQRLYKGEGAWKRYDELVGDDTIVTAEDFLKPAAFKPVLQQIMNHNRDWDPIDEKVFETNGKLLAIQLWLTKNGKTGDDLKTLINEIKSQLFENLKPSHLEETYFDVLELILREFEDRNHVED